MVTPAASEALAVLSSVDRETAIQGIRVELARRRLEDFIKQSWHVLQPRQPLQYNWHIGAIAEHMEAVDRRQIRRLIINISPRTLKSFIVSVAYPAWVWLHDPSRQFLCTAAAQKVVTRDSKYHRRLVQSLWYRTMFQPEWTIERGDNSVGYFSNTAMGHRISLTRGEGVTGLGCDDLLVDDYLDAREGHSDKAALANHTTQYEEGPATRLNDENEGTITVIMQRLNQLDLTAYLLDQGGWELLCIPAEYEGPRSFTSLGWQDPRTEEGESFFPERFSKEVLERKKRQLGPRTYAGQFQQRPDVEGGTLFRKEWLRTWTPATLPDIRYRITSWDCAFKKSDETDYVVGQLWGVHGADSYLLWQVRARMDLDETIRATFEMDRAFPGSMAHVIELKANGRKVIDALHRHVAGLQEFDPQGSSKEERANAALPVLSAGNVWIPDEMECSTVERDYSWVRGWRKEVLAFPQARRDDQVDAMTQALIWIAENGPREPWCKVIGSGTRR